MEGTTTTKRDSSNRQGRQGRKGMQTTKKGCQRRKGTQRNSHNDNGTKSTTTTKKNIAETATTHNYGKGTQTTKRDKRKRDRRTNGKGLARQSGAPRDSANKQERRETKTDSNDEKGLERRKGTRTTIRD